MVWNYKRVIAHRGGGNLAPENTLAAIEMGISYSFEGVEFDVMLSKDSVPILMHDEYTGRTVKSSLKGIADHTSEELLNLDAGSWFDIKYSDVRVPLFRDVMNYCHGKQIWMNIEIKPYPGFEHETGLVVAQEVKQFFEEFPHQDENALPLFSSFSYESLQAAHEVFPMIRRGFITHTLSEFPNWKEKCHAIGIYSIHLNEKFLTPEIAKEVRQEGFALFCFTVNDLSRAQEIIPWGVEAFCTDRLDVFQDFQFPI